MQRESTSTERPEGILRTLVERRLGIVRATVETREGIQCRFRAGGERDGCSDFSPISSKQVESMVLYRRVQSSRDPGCRTSPATVVAPPSLRPKVSTTSSLVALLALCTSACSSELGGGNEGLSSGVEPFGTSPPGESEASVSGADPSALPSGSNPASSRPASAEPGASEGELAVANVGEEPSLGAAVNPAEVIDDAGDPLPVDQLPDLPSCDTPGPRMIRRLTSEQYLNTLASVFGDEHVPDVNPLIDASTLGYNVDADANIVAGLDAQSLMTTAEAVAASARESGFVSSVANGCTQLANPDCGRQFVRNLGSQIAREPFPESRVASYLELFYLTSDEGEELVSTFEDGAELVMTAMVQSPYLLYRRELGEQNGSAFQLTSFEVASQLSYFLTNAPPDEQLLQAAANDLLRDVSEIENQAARLLQTQAAERVLSRFAHEWLDVDGLETKVKDIAGQELSPSVRSAMLRETEELFLELFESGGTIEELFSANYTFVNRELAGFYGWTGVDGDDFVSVQLDGTNRIPGVLGHGAFLAEHALANNSSPVQRALIVRERLLCDPMGPVPSGLDTNLRPPDPNLTNRQRYAAHSVNEPCRTCHALMDPIGFTFENYDTFGRYRETESGQLVDSTGGVPLRTDSGLVTVPVDDATGLTEYLSQSEIVRACLASNLSYYAYGLASDVKWPAEQRACTDNAVRQLARESGNTLQSVLTGILRAPHFTRRVQDL